MPIVVVYTSLNVNYTYSDMVINHLNGIGIDFKAGIKIAPRTIIYGIASAQEFKVDKDSSIGLGYGGGFETIFTQYFSSTLDFKTYEMKDKSGVNNYNYDTLILNMKIKF